jgi:hypothetical protein
MVFHPTLNMAGYFLPLDVLKFRETKKKSQKITCFVFPPWAMSFPTKAASGILAIHNQKGVARTPIEKL